MAKLSNLLKLPVKPEREVSRILRRLEANKTPVRVEIENSNTRFYSIISIKRGLVVVAKPPGLESGLQREGFVRFKIPDEDGRELRMQVSVPHFNLLSGGYVFLCSVPRKFAESSLRGAERYNTTRFKNLALFLPELKGYFRIIDISKTGCKVFADQSMATPGLETGSPISPASITVGNKVNIDLHSVTLRSRIKNTMGFELRVGDDGSSTKYFEHFLKSLEAAESKRLSTHTAEEE